MDYLKKVNLKHDDKLFSMFPFYMLKCINEMCMFDER